MHILFLTDNFPPEVNAPATRTYEHAIRWIKEGCKVTVITCAPNFPEGKVFSGYKNKWYQYQVIDDINVVRVKTFIGIQEFDYENHPFDVVGWDGYYFPWIFSIHDFEPIVGSIHQPPPIHQTFQAPGFVICSFVPRLFDFHPDSIPAPYPHSNVDSDEIIYYSRGNFMSRQGISQESITLHPMGLPHGPQPGKYHSSAGKEKTDELAVMIDTFKPLNITEAARSIDEKDYPLSWMD